MNMSLLSLIDNADNQPYNSYLLSNFINNYGGYVATSLALLNDNLIFTGFPVML